MTTQTKKQTKEGEKGKRPTHTLFVTNYVNGSPIRLRIGAAWKHEKGNGFNIALDDIVAFENKPKEDGQTKPNVSQLKS